MSDDAANHHSKEEDDGDDGGEGAQGAEKKRPLVMQLLGANKKKKKKKRPPPREDGPPRHPTTAVRRAFFADAAERPERTTAVGGALARRDDGAPLVIPAQRDTFQTAAAAATGRTGPDGVGDNPEEDAATTAAACAVVKKEEHDAPNHDGGDDDEEATAAAVRALQEQAGAAAQQHQPNGSTTSNVRTIRSSNMIQNELQQQETQQYRADLERLPDELGETAEAYQAVPIAEFGAALLRGMGWTGDDDGDDKKKNAAGDTVLPRPHRLGLGAIPAAVAMHPDDGGSAPPSRRGRRPDQYERDKSVREQQARYRREREAQVAADRQRTLQNGSLVLLTTTTATATATTTATATASSTTSNPKNNHPPRRARIQKLVGVPGLNRVSVVLEDGDTATTIPRSEIDRLLTRRELEEHPFREPQRQRVERGNRSDDRTLVSKTKSGDRDSSRGGDDDDRSKERDRKRRHRREDDDESSKRRKDDKRSSKSNGGGSSSSSKKRPRDEPPLWIVPHIRVRVITEKLGRRHCKQKGVVVDVTPAGATLQMDDGGLVLDHVPERYLETALPPLGGPVVVLAGRQKRTRGRLLERTSREGVVQDADMNLHTLSLDDLAEWCGPRDG